MNQRESGLTVTSHIDSEWPAALGRELPSPLLMPIWLSASNGAVLAYRLPSKPLPYVVNLWESGSSDSSSIFSHTAFPINALSVWVDYLVWSWSPKPSQSLTYTEQIYYHANVFWDSYLLCTYKYRTHEVWCIFHLCMEIRWKCGKKLRQGKLIIVQAFFHLWWAFSFLPSPSPPPRNCTVKHSL